MFFLAIAVAVPGCGRPAGDRPTGDPAETGAPGIKTPSNQAPNFTLRDLDGHEVRLSDSAGKLRLIDFWATWCAPCREEIPGFKELYSKYADKGLAIIAISMDEEGAKVVRPFVEKERIPYTNLIGNDEVAQSFGGVLGLPTAFLVDKDGKILASWVGGVPRRIFEKKVREALGLEPT